MCFSCIYITEMLYSHPIRQYYTNTPFCNVLQILKEKLANNGLKDKKAEVVLEGIASMMQR